MPGIGIGLSPHEILQEYSAGPPPFKFDLGAVTFTPYMAKRAGQGPFAAAPIVQGMWDGSGVPDVVTFLRGNLIGNQTQYEYANYDWYQGAITFWITPEWDGNDGIRHGFLSDGGDFIIEKTTGNLLRFWTTVGNDVSVDISGWTAGTTYSIIIRWDSINTLDGSNYKCLSVNDVHTFGNTVAPSIEPNTLLRFGSNGNLYPANAIIEGLTIYRRPLYDGTYGVRPMNGNQYSDDEIAAIYAAGAGRDPTLVTGSEDVCFCLPTNSTEEILATGTGEAWSWPWEDNLPDVWGNWDGGLPGTDYAVEFNGTTTEINCGSDVDIDDIMDAEATVEGWFRRDSAGQSNVGFSISKGNGGTNGWILFGNATQIIAWVICATTNAVTTISNVPDGKFHHLTMYFNDAGDRKIYLAVDGVWITGSQTAGVGAIVSDAAENLIIGNRSGGGRTMDGGIAWVAISKNDRHTHGTDFIPPRAFPADDANYLASWAMDEGTGALVANTGNQGGAGSGAANRDGTLTNGSWSSIWEQDSTPVIPQSLEFDGSDTRNVIADAATIQDLHDAAFTVEAWIRADGWGESSYGMIATKGQSIGVGWAFQLRSGYGIRGVINCATADGIAQCSNAAFYPDGRWHHVAMTWDDAWGNTFPKLWVDGIEPTYFDTQNRNGLVVSDIGADMTIGNQGGWDRTFNGNIGWVRVSNILRYTNEFAPPARSNPPGIDGNTMVQHNMTDGAGATATDTSGNANHGTITSGAWNNTPDMEIDEPGASIYGPKGYNLGVDAAGEGMYIEQTVTEETDYVVFPVLSIGESGRARPRIRIRDMTGAADIVTFNGPMLYGQHTGGNNSPTLIPTTPRWIADALIGATVYNITDGSSATITDNTEDVVTAALAGGTDNDWDTNDYFVIRFPRGYCEWPWQESFCFQTPSGCATLRVYIENINGEGVTQIHQVQVLPNALTNGDHESLTGANPDLITGWTNSDLDPGDTQASSGGVGTIHAGAEALQWAVGASNEGMYISIAGIGDGTFFTHGGWFYGDGTIGVYLTPSGANALLQYSATDRALAAGTLAQWVNRTGAFRSLAANPTFFILAQPGAGGNRFSDDCYIVVHNDVSLTCTPASYANSLEAGGLRIDGRDDCTQPVANLRFNMGWIWFSARPRHGPPDVTQFGQTAEYLFYLWENANNYIRCWRTNNLINLEYNANGAGAVNGNWNCLGAWAIDQEVEIWVRYGPFGMWLEVDGVQRINLAFPNFFTADFTAAIQWGADMTPANQFDGVIS